MTDGTKNEDHTVHKFASMDYYDEFYNVGLLKWDAADNNIGVWMGLHLLKF